MKNNLYEHNIRFLSKKCFGDSIANIGKAETLGAAEVMHTVSPNTGDEFINIQLNLATGKKVQIHSNRDPYREAAKLVERWVTRDNVSKNSTVIVFGIGCGYHLQALSDWAGNNTNIVVIDFIPELIKVIVKAQDFTHLAIKWQQVKLCVSDDFDEVWQFVSNEILSNLRKPVAFFTHPGLERIFKDVYHPLIHKLQTYLRFLFQSWLTEAVHSQAWIENSLKNLPSFLNMTPVNSLENIFIGKPAIIVAAGPSLDKSIEVIKTRQDQAVIIAVGRSYNTLIRHGIHPHFVVAVDGCQQLYDLQFKDIPDDDYQQSLLLASPNVDPNVFQLFPNRSFAFSLYALAEFNAWLKWRNINYEILFGAGTVTLTAIDAAAYFGCKEIMLLGFDLAVEDNGRAHAKFAKYELEDLETNLVQVAGNWRKNVYTTAIFSSYINGTNVFLQQVKESLGCQIYNINDRGALIKETILYHPEELDLIPWRKDPEIQDIMNELLIENKREDNYIDTHKILEETKKDILDFLQKTADARDLCAQIINSPSLNNKKMMKKLDALEKDINTPSAASILVQSLLKKGELDTSFISATVSDKYHGMQRAMQQSAILFHNLNFATVYLHELIEKIDW